MSPIRADSLVLYKTRPARVLVVGEKIEIELEGSQTKKVRAKDIQLLHPGPLRSLSELTSREGDLQTAWELLQGTDSRLQELAELMFDAFSPVTAWCAWQRVAEGLYFSGTPEAIAVRTPEAVSRDLTAQAAKEAAERDRGEFLERLGRAALEESDRDRLREVEALALGRADRSRILQALGHEESRENAHRLLVASGYWAPNHNPYPGRLGVSLEDPRLPLPELPTAGRRDLTHLEAFAIDDEGNRDPDDAISLDGDRIWVHVADVAALAGPDSDLDREARARGANLYLPECTVNMLPEALTEALGLGLQAPSPALSVGLRLNADAEPVDVEIVPSWLRVQRISYEEAEGRLDEEPFRSLYRLTRTFRERRYSRNAARIELPEVSVRLVGGEVRLRPLPRLQSLDLVTDAMLMAGEAVARYCLEREIPIPFATQPAPERLESPADLAAMYAYRKQFRPTRLSVEAEPHFGLGIPCYTRATSPLRRYSDLLVHQQLRAHLGGGVLLSRAEVSERVGGAETAGGNLRRAERLSNQHWKLVYLRDHPGWRGMGTVVEKDGQKATLLIAELALEAKVRLRSDPVLNDLVKLVPRELDLPALTCYFRARD